MAQTHKDSDVMTDADFEKALDALREQNESAEVGELLKMMNENRMISWEEAEQILEGANCNVPVKSSLPEQTRPTEPDNDTDVDASIERLQQNDETLKEINLNNMKRTPIPQVQRLIEAIKDNTHLEKLSLANMGLYDGHLEPLLKVIEENTTLRSINLETNYLSGEFFAKLFKAALKNQTLEEVKAVNQGRTFATTAEREIIDAVFENRGLLKVSVTLRLPEGRHKIENATLRNGEIRRALRRQAAQKAKEEEEAAKKANAEVKKSTDSTAKTKDTSKGETKPSTKAKVKSDSDKKDSEAKPKKTLAKKDDSASKTTTAKPAAKKVT
uniref:Tropomodulin n=1 Tax=Syphacia muris TaxID=451379 RepID=A0A0N5A7V7_9BILA